MNDAAIEPESDVTKRHFFFYKLLKHIKNEN